jgi:hypothetical protein
MRYLHYNFRVQNYQFRSYVSKISDSPKLFRMILLNDEACWESLIVKAVPFFKIYFVSA